MATSRGGLRSAFGINLYLLLPLNDLPEYVEEPPLRPCRTLVADIYERDIRDPFKNLIFKFDCHVAITDFEGNTPILSIVNKFNEQLAYMEITFDNIEGHYEV